MNLKNSTEMLNSELANTSFNQSTVQQINSQWTPSSLSQISPHHKNCLNNLPAIYNEIPPTTEATFSCLTNQTQSSNYFPNSNLESTANIQLNDQSKVFANSQLSPHYYNHHLHHSQPIINNNSLMNNSNIYDFTNELSSNGQKTYLDSSVQHVVNTTNNFHHYNISLHHPNNTPNLSTEPPINFHHLQLENNLLDQQNQTNLSTSTIPLNVKKRKKMEQICSNNVKNCSETTKNITLLKNSVKKEPNISQNQIKEETKQSNLDLTLDPNDNYANYDYFNADYSEQNSNYSSNAFLESVFQSIKFYPFQQNNWHNLYDENFNKL